MESFTTQDLIAELQEYHTPIGERREGGVTVAEYAEGNNCTTRTARKRLTQFVKDGVLVKEECHLGPRKVGFVYYRTEKK